MSHGTVELHGGGSRVVLVPTLGGRLTMLESGGRQWLLPLPHGSNSALPAYGAPYDDRFVGGYDDCFPTRAACTLPQQVPGYAGLALPEHGELWSRPCAVEIDTARDGQRALCRWKGVRLPYHAEREVHMRGDGEVVLRYRVTNDGAARMPFLWCADLALPLTPVTRLLLPDGLVAKVIRAQGVELGGEGTEHRWPRFPMGKRLVDLSRPATVGKRFAARFALVLPAGRATIHEGPARLDIAVEPAEVPNLAVEVVRRPGGFLSRRGAASRLTVAPAIGTPDALSDALGAWQSAHWIAPGETRAWSVRLRGVPGGGASGG